jgi:hypothetical protein
VIGKGFTSSEHFARIESVAILRGAFQTQQFKNQDSEPNR